MIIIWKLFEKLRIVFKFCNDKWFIQHEHIYNKWLKDQYKK